MPTQNILIKTSKYHHNIKRAYFEIPPAIMSLTRDVRNGNIRFRECLIEVNITLKLSDDKIESVAGYLDENALLVYIIGEYGHREEIFTETFTDSTLCAIQDRVDLWK